MKNRAACCVLYGLFVVILATNAGGIDSCSWYTKLKCPTKDFLCLNGRQCIGRALYCNNVTDCDDGSDERYCYDRKSCPENFRNCYSIHRCLPSEWFCNGYIDCSSRDDERNCRRRYRRSEKRSHRQVNRTAEHKVERWIRKQNNHLSVVEKWGSNVDSLALILYNVVNFDFSKYTSLEKTEIAYELNIQMISQLSSKKLEDIPSTELASYVNAFLVMCINPRNFHGYDLVEELGNRIGQENYTNPQVLLALCNAGQTITESGKKKLIDTFWNKRRTDWTDMQSVAVMALACANKQPENEVDSETLRNMTLELKQQYSNGTFENLNKRKRLRTIALIMQALISTAFERDPVNFDEIRAYEELLRNQKSDGSFGDIRTTFLVAPVLTCRSLVDINSDHCSSENKDEISAVDNLSKSSGPEIRVQYSLWFGNEKDLERNLILRVPQNVSLYKVMETAAEINSWFKFEYLVKNRKPYINAISGMRENPLTGKFWFLYDVESEQPILSNESPADIIPKDNDHYVMWYRSGTWVD